jgi:hypothetical protein
MQKFYLLFAIAVSACCVAHAQTDSLSKQDKAALDSMMEKDEFLKLMKGASKNWVDISIGAGNGAFSSHNNAANATGTDNQVIFTPSVVYRTKTGFSLGVTAFLTNDSAHKLELYQTGLTAAYDYSGDDVAGGIAYTRYLSDKNKYNTKALYQNDLYGYIKKAKGIIQPGLALGFDNGEYKEWNLVRKPISGEIINDSTDNKASYFSVSASIEHDFSFYTILSTNDELDFVPSLILNFGADKLTQVHTNKINVNGVLIRRIVSNRKKRESSNKFQMQSVATSFDFTYSIGKFFLQPNVYLDYYLPETTGNRLSAIFSLAAGFSF